MDFGCRTICAALSTALLAGCQPIQTAPVAAPPVLFPAPPAMAAAPLPNTAVVAPPPAQGGPPLGPVVANPLYVPVANQDWAWEQIVDVVEDYFRVERENRVQLVGNVLTEGRIDTFPQIGATILEPQRPDSVGRYNRWESTFQTIRRRAVLRVIPAQGGYLIDLAVYKELEDLPRPEQATAGAATFRNDSSLPSQVDESISHTRLSSQWLPLGRDTAVEQQMLAVIQARLVGNAGGVVVR